MENNNEVVGLLRLVARLSRENSELRDRDRTLSLNDLSRENAELLKANRHLVQALDQRDKEIDKLNQAMVARGHLVDDLQAEAGTLKTRLEDPDRHRAIYDEGYLDALQDLDRTCVEMLKENSTDLGAELIREVRLETFRKAGEHEVKIPPMMLPAGLDQVVPPQDRCICGAEGPPFHHKPPYPCGENLPNMSRLPDNYRVIP